MPYEIVIWLEVHLKLNSPNKLFCRCKNEQEFDNLTPNTHVCPTCMGHPGALPVLNQEPLEKAVQLWLALQCDVPEISFFDRKSYFYPDLPMGYQITQLLQPTNVDGEVSFFVDKEYEESRVVRISDAHIETDTGKSIHSDGWVILDFNRAGTPLVEIVTHPDFSSADEVVAFLKHIQRIARFNGIGDADMEKGQLRVDVNLSLKEVGSEILGTRTETKNMNSFWAIQRAIAYETKRQTELLEEWKQVEQTTRWRDDPSGTSFVMRSKEDAMDYRYFPEPDMPPIKLTESQVDEIRKLVVKGPFLRILSYKQDYGFNKEYINALINDNTLNTCFESCVEEWYEPAEVAKRLVWPIQRRLNDKQIWFDGLPFSRGYFVTFLELIKEGKLANAQAKIVMTEMLDGWNDPVQIIEDKWLKPVWEDEVWAWLDQIFSEKPDLLEDLKAWNMKPMWFVVWQVMKLSGGAADPGMVNGLIKKRV